MIISNDSDLDYVTERTGISNPDLMKLRRLSITVKKAQEAATSSKNLHNAEWQMRSRREVQEYAASLGLEVYYAGLAPTFKTPVGMGVPEFQFA